MNIEELLNKYFEGETTCDEENQICQYFMKEAIPEHLLIYKPLFAFFDEEKKLFREENTSVIQLVPVNRYFNNKSHRKLIVYALSGLAACALLTIGIFTFERNSASQAPDNYVVVNGKCITDKAMVKAYAEASLSEVSTSKEEIFSELFNE